ncbi:probable folylpolyglutamate synthase [Rhynchosporium agropyri]|uniref:Folylpolyglutamate synthase n=1 Tax=Rhynchosporium agropyri TaxID=914238 RepID=A0A1E1L7G9_9HELO|nr:probable folylpolyglutamate synthase [Rhynchosporium agropyri]
MATRTYNDAINLLNTLQTSYEVLKKRWDANIRIDEGSNQEIRRCLARIGYSQRDLNKLNIVHVAGTKGKGSTCAYVDSMLSRYRKSHDFPRNVGLFTSPHLIAVRERIRINSAPLSAELFAKYFFEVWDRLEAAAAESSVPFEKPVYFRYLNLMSYHVFMQEKVDAAIYEVGVGGEFDSTNIVDCPAVTGISTLGIDHTFTLGETIDKIAWHKAGIQKKNVPSFTVSQLPAALDVIQKRAKERGVKSLDIVGLDPRLEGVRVRPDATFQKSNASLAIALTETLLKKLDGYQPYENALPKEFVDGLEQVVWRGRCEKKLDGDITWYLDGAHTADSIIVAAKWFGDECAEQPGPRVLIFNQQGHRESVELLEGLHNAIKSQGSIKFDHVIFCPTVPSSEASKKDHVNLSTESSALAGLTMQKVFAEKWRALDPSSHTTIHVLPSVEDGFDVVQGLSKQDRDSMGKEKVHALITGSVHLIGRALGILEDVDAL